LVCQIRGREPVLAIGPQEVPRECLTDHRLYKFFPLHPVCLRVLPLAPAMLKFCSGRTMLAAADIGIFLSCLVFVILSFFFFSRDFVITTVYPGVNTTASQSFLFLRPMPEPKPPRTGLIFRTKRTGRPHSPDRSPAGLAGGPRVSPRGPDSSNATLPRYYELTSLDLHLLFTTFLVHRFVLLFFLF